MKLIVIFGPQAVGKMSVGKELAKQTGLKLFHNHMTIDLVANFFSYSTDTARRLVKLFRREIFEEVAKSDLKGIIFTFIWNFNSQGDLKYLSDLKQLYENHNGDVYFVELEANLDTRIKRNKHPLRLQEKPTKRNIEWSHNNLIESLTKHRLNSLEGEVKFKNYIKINNTNLSPEEVSKIIIKSFKF